MPMDALIDDNNWKKRGPPPGVRVIRRLKGREPSFKSYRISVLVMTFIAYTCYHASRKPLSIVKSVLDPEEFNSSTFNRSLTSIHTWPGNYILSTPPSETRNPALASNVGTNGLANLRRILKVPNRWNGSAVRSGNPIDGWPPFNKHMGKGLLGNVDLAFLAAYSLGMYYAGHLGDRLDLRLFLSAGMIGSGFFVCLFGMAYWLNVHFLAYFIVVQVFAGLLQSTGWPSVVSVMGKWFGKSQRGLIMGVWNAHTSIGNILGSLMAAAVLKFGWGWSFVLPGMLQALGGLLMYLFLVVEPSDVGLVSPNDEQQQESEEIADDQADEKERDVESGLLSDKKQIAATSHLSGRDADDQEDKKPDESPLLLQRSMDPVPVLTRNESAIGFWEAWKVPGVAPFAFCLFFAKLVAYTFLDWLPFYIKQTKIAGKYLDDRTAGNLSTLFDVGGVIGGILAGHLSDKLNARAITATVFMFFAIPALYMYRTYGGMSMPLNIALMMLVGMLVNGPYALITTAVSADLGTHSSLHGNPRALATVTAIIDGTGSVGAAVGPLLTGYVSELGWGVVFLFLMLAALIAGLLLTRLVIAEVSDKLNKAHSNQSKGSLREEDLGDL